MLPDLAIDASRSSASQRTGTEWYSYEIIRAIATTEGRPPLRLYHRRPVAEPSGPDIAHITVERRRFWTHLGLSRAMRRDRPSALFVPSHVIPAIHPPATIVTVHDLGYRYEPDAHTRQRRLELDATTRWNAARAARIIVPSEQTKSDLVAYHATAPEKIDVIHHGVDHDRFRRLDPSQVAATLESLGIRTPYLLFLGTVQPRKNLVRLVAAFERLGRSDLNLVIAGQAGWKVAPIERRIAASPARGRILRFGHLPDEVVPALYNGAAAFVLPSLYEGFGMGILEAMACGCPVVTSDRSSLPEIAGDAAILVDPVDPEAIAAGIRQALEPSNRERLVTAGLERARSFTWQRAARETLTTIERAYEESRGQG